jgi:hypothetical protein
MDSFAWQQRIDKIISRLVIAFAFGTAINLLYQGFFARTMPWKIIIGVWSLSLVLICVLRDWSVINKLVALVSEYFISPIVISPIYLIIGNVRNLRLLKAIEGTTAALSVSDNKNSCMLEGLNNTTLAIYESNTKTSRLLTDIHKTTIAMQESALFGRIAELRNPRIQEYYLVYTHKPGHTEAGNLENYRMAGFPVDESQMIMRLWYFLTNNLYLDWSRIKPVCGCLFDSQSDRDHICSGSFSIIGSPKGNLFCGLIMEIISTMDKNHIFLRNRRYLMKLDEGENKDCYIEENGNIYRPSPINPFHPPSPNDILTDYALLMKLPNILNTVDDHSTHVTLLFAGCKVGGQTGITEWFFAPENLAQLAIDYNAKYFQILLEVHYHYVPQATPKIVETSVLWKEEIRYTPVRNGG